jgi:hypothetical protein
MLISNVFIFTRNYLIHGEHSSPSDPTPLLAIATILHRQVVKSKPMSVCLSMPPAEINRMPCGEKEEDV